MILYAIYLLFGFAWSLLLYGTVDVPDCCETLWREMSVPSLVFPIELDAPHPFVISEGLYNTIFTGILLLIVIVFFVVHALKQRGR